jgi:hypothetical protein
MRLSASDRSCLREIVDEGPFGQPGPFLFCSVGPPKQFLSAPGCAWSESSGECRRHDAAEGERRLRSAAVGTGRIARRRNPSGERLIAFARWNSPGYRPPEARRMRPPLVERAAGPAPYPSREARRGASADLLALVAPQAPFDALALRPAHQIPNNQLKRVDRFGILVGQSVVVRG